MSELPQLSQRSGFSNNNNILPKELKDSSFKTQTQVKKSIIYQVEEAASIIPEPQHIDLESISGEELCKRYLPNKVIYKRVIKNITDALIMKIKGKKGQKKRHQRKRKLQPIKSDLYDNWYENWCQANLTQKKWLEKQQNTKKQYQQAVGKTQKVRIEANRKRKSELIEMIEKDWKRYLTTKETRLIIIDAFWYQICSYFFTGQYPVHEKFFLKRIAENYINFFFQVEENHKELFFNKYFNLISQGVFYSLYYAFPISRGKFNTELAKNILQTFSLQFTGIEFTNLNKLIKDWHLNLGTGNILFLEDKSLKLPQIQHLKKTTSLAVKRRHKKKNYQMLQYSTLVDHYLKDKNYQTRNYVRSFKMKTKNLNEDAREKERIFAGYKRRSQQILARTSLAMEEDKKRKIKLEKEINKIKAQSRDHQVRLDNRKKEELDKGAHEYANYLVSMLNSGLDNLVFDPYSGH